MNNNDEMSLGEQRVRLDFNPSANDMVTKIKQKSAELINLCEDLKGQDPRLAALAQTAYEEGAMWAVKAATATVSTANPAAPAAGGPVAPTGTTD